MGIAPRARRLALPDRLGRAILVWVLALPALAGPAAAALCQTDTVPAATLLLPYFEIDLDNPNGLTTLFSINNAAAGAVLTHIVIWSDLAVPVLSFNVYLTGYDVQSINLRDVIVNGSLPQTASLGQDPSDTISPHGAFSQDINFRSCDGQLPPQPLSSSFLAHLQNALTGKASPLLGNACAGQALGDNVARGYVTVDTVNNCTSRFPGDVGYFAPDRGGDVTDQNVLWGAWYIVNTTQNFAQASDMVPIEADETNPAVAAKGKYSFYGRYDGWTGTDGREPLATTFAAQFFLGGAFNGGTSFLVWRDPKLAQAAFPCPAALNLRPAWYPLSQEGFVIFDEQEHPFGGLVSQTIPAFFPAATQRAQVGTASLPIPLNFGWLYFDLNGAVDAAGSNPPADPRAAQAWVIAVQTSNGHFAVALDAARLDSACDANHLTP
ncbi:MAG TPA: hypothetical protein VHQ90_12425 [Thermoanaerobaculia bacterium]|nr:hypothetical protein [Thermoanaerobaculia bacterium]